MARILIVDDEKMITSLFGTLCRQQGHEAVTASTLQEGLKEISGSAYDLVMLDVFLPDGNGLENIEKFRAAASSPMVIIMTAAGDPRGAELAIKSGAWDYLSKPVPAQEVILTLTRALEYRQIEQSQYSISLLRREELVGGSPKIMQCLKLMEKARLAGSEMNVLITGETGTGKEVVAGIIHKNSSRCGKPFIVVDCSSLPENLVESVLFGHVRGAFTGAVEDRVGLIKKADEGTLFLDEVGELPLPMQKNLLRVLQEHTFRPVGSTQEVTSTFRLIAATNRDLASMVQEHCFREDLLYRLRTIQIDLPPLRERKEDYYPLMVHSMKNLHQKYGHGIKGIGPDFLEAVHHYPWPGNIREMKNAMEYSYLMAAKFPTLSANHLPPDIRIHIKKVSLSENLAPRETHLYTFHLPMTLKEFKKETEKYYLQVLTDHTRGKIEEATRISGLSRPRLYSLLKQRGVGTKSNTGRVEGGLKNNTLLKDKMV